MLPNLHRFRQENDSGQTKTIRGRMAPDISVSVGETFGMSIRWMDGRKLRKDRRSLLMKMGYSIYDKVRRRLAQDNKWRCHYCHNPVYLIPYSSGDLATIDHKTPLGRGGNWKRYNLTCACRGCNE